MTPEEDGVGQSEQVYFEFQTCADFWRHHSSCVASKDEMQATVEEKYVKKILDMHNLDMRPTQRTFNDMMRGQKVSQPHVSGKPGI